MFTFFKFESSIKTLSSIFLNPFGKVTSFNWCNFPNALFPIISTPLPIFTDVIYWLTFVFSSNILKQFLFYFFTTFPSINSGIFTLELSHLYLTRLTYSSPFSLQINIFILSFHRYFIFYRNLYCIIFFILSLPFNVNSLCKYFLFSFPL